MPWCEECSRFFTPSTLTRAGECPSCGRAVVSASAPPDAAVGGSNAAVDADVAPPVPWHFKLLVVAVVLYLGWRLVQGIAWVVSHV